MLAGQARSCLVLRIFFSMKNDPLFSDYTWPRHAFGSGAAGNARVHG